VRIASLLPAATEIVGALGLADDLVAVTYECDEPADVRQRCAVVVDTALPAGLDPAQVDAVVRDRAARGLPLYALDREALAAAAPDLILTQDLCRVCALPSGDVTAALAAIGSDAGVVEVDPHTVDEVLAAIATIAARAGHARAGTALVAQLRDRLATVARAVDGRPRPRVLVLEWTDPPYLPGHWVPELVRRAGGVAAGGTDGARSIAVTWGDIAAFGVDLTVVAPCGFGLDDAVVQGRAVLDRLPAGPVVAVDSASYVVRGGPRLVDGVEALASVLHPGAVAQPPPGRVSRLR